MIFNPGFKAYEAGVEAAWLAQQYLTPPPSQKKQKNSTNMAPRRTANSYKKNTYKKTTDMRKKSGTSVVKQTILDMASVYHSATIDGTCGNGSMTSNQIYNFPLTAQITQGTTQANRTGDSVYLSALKLRGYIASPVTSSVYFYRIIVGFCNNTNLNVSLLASGFTAADVFLNTPTSAYVNGIINPKAFTALYDAQFTVNSQVSGASDGIHWTDTIPINQKFQYDASNSALGKSKNLFILVIPTAVGTTAAGSCAISTDLIFKNL